MQMSEICVYFEVIQKINPVLTNWRTSRRINFFSNIMFGSNSSHSGHQNIPSNEECGIRDVWAHNLYDEFKTIRKVVQKYHCVAMDTEFPGVVARPIGEFRSSADYQYQLLRCNVDLLRIIQLGLTFLDEAGKTPPGYSTWQFNFKFNLSCKNLKGGLQEVADQLELERVGPQHQAGSDSLLTGMAFFKMREMFFEDNIDDAKYCGHLYGLGTSFVMNGNNYHDNGENNSS
ncbi:hypothetical protein B566_EDAN001758 [Ephemera danica]|nr:hypothetical protein B566_EDAN001758 [Ephemera danica]